MNNSEKPEKKDNILKKLNEKPVRKVKYPSKTSINMMTCGEKTNTGKTLAIGGVLILLLAILVAKVGVYDQYARLDKAESEYNQIHQQNQALEEKTKDYDSVSLQYRAYSMSFISDEEDENYVAVDRKDILDLIEDVMMSRGEVITVTINKNTAVVTMTGMNLKEISRMNQELKQRDIVSDVQLNIAQTEEQKAASILNFSDTIYLQSAEEAN